MRRTEILRRCGFWLALLVGGCSAVLEPTASPPPAPQVEAEPPYRAIIAEHIDTIFSKDAQMHSVAISGLRRAGTAVGPEWLVCLRGTANSVAGGSSTRTYAIFINKRSQIVDRRLAEPKDECDRERFEPLAQVSR